MASGGGLAGRARDPYTPRQGGTHGRQDTEATPEAEEAEDADLRDPLGHGSASSAHGPAGGLIVPPRCPTPSAA